MESKSKSQTVQIIIIIILSVLLVVSLGLGATFAWFGNQASAGTTMTMGGKIIIKLENSESKSATFVDKSGLLPGTNVESDVNIMVSQSSTPCFLRAKIDISVEPKFPDKMTLSEGAKAMIIDTFNEGISKIVNSTGTLFIDSIAFSNSTEGEGFGDVVTCGAKWILHDGWFYFVSVDQDSDATDPADITLLNLYTGNGGKLVTFVKGDFNLPGLEWGNELKDCNITFDITAQAVQIFQRKHEGEDRRYYHNETLDYALTVFGEALDPRIEFYANGGTGTVPTEIVPNEELPVGSVIQLPGADLTKGGKAFKCWNTREDGNGTSYYAGDDLKITPARKRLYAIYED